MAALRCLLLLLFAPVLQAADVLLLSEENPPLNFTRAGQPSGFSSLLKFAYGLSDFAV